MSIFVHSSPCRLSTTCNHFQTIFFVFSHIPNAKKNKNAHLFGKLAKSLWLKYPWCCVPLAPVPVVPKGGGPAIGTFHQIGILRCSQQGGAAVGRVRMSTCQRQVSTLSDFFAEQQEKEGCTKYMEAPDLLVLLPKGQVPDPMPWPAGQPPHLPLSMKKNCSPLSEKKC